jgi:hypothetical protein
MARWPPVAYNHWCRYQMVLMSQRGNRSTSAPPANPVSRTDHPNIGPNAGAACDPNLVAHHADPGVAGNRRTQIDQANKIPEQQRFSEYCIDDAALIAKLESIHLRLLTLVDRADA